MVSNSFHIQTSYNSLDSELVNQNTQGSVSQQGKFLVDKKTASIWVKGLEQLNTCSNELREKYDKKREKNEKKYALIQQAREIENEKERAHILNVRDELYNFPPSWEREKNRKFTIYSTDLKDFLSRYKWTERIVSLFQNYILAMNEAHIRSIPLSFIMEDQVVMEGQVKEDQALIFQRYFEINPSQRRYVYDGIRKKEDYDARRQPMLDSYTESEVVEANLKNCNQEKEDYDAHRRLEPFEYPESEMDREILSDLTQGWVEYDIRREQTDITSYTESEIVEANLTNGNQEWEDYNARRKLEPSEYPESEIEKEILSDLTQDWEEYGVHREQTNMTSYTEEDVLNEILPGFNKEWAEYEANRRKPLATLYTNEDALQETLSDCRKDWEEYNVRREQTNMTSYTEEDVLNEILSNSRKEWAEYDANRHMPKLVPSLENPSFLSHLINPIRYACHYLISLTRRIMQVISKCFKVST